MSEAVSLAWIQELIAAGHHRQAMPLLDGLLASDQDGLAALRLLAECQLLEGQENEAEASLQLSLLFDSADGPTLVMLARLRWQRGELQEALPLVQAALASALLGGDDGVLLVRILHDAELFDEALQVCKRLLLSDGESAEVWFAQAMVLQCLGRYPLAIEAYGKALLYEPDWHQAAVNRGLLRLLAGDALGGGEDYERRWLLEELRDPPVAGLPRWDGQLCPGTVLIWAEQGLGDEMFWLGFLSAVAHPSQRLLLLLDSRLVALAARSFPGITVLPRTGEGLDLSDLVAAIPLGSLPLLLARRQQSLPLPFQRWLRTDSPAPIDGDGLCRIGLFWRSFQPQRGRIKSLDLIELAPLAALPGLRLQSLQYGDARQALDRFRIATGVEIQPPGFDPHEDIDQLAAAIAACDGVVTIPSVVAHLCGVLGVPCLVLSVSSRGRPWYWEGEGTTCPWYPSVQVWRCSSREASPQRLAAVGTWVREQVQRRSR